jgi:hypothetical protein
MSRAICVGTRANIIPHVSVRVRVRVSVTVTTRVRVRVSVTVTARVRVRVSVTIHVRVRVPQAIVVHVHVPQAITRIYIPTPPLILVASPTPGLLLLVAILSLRHASLLSRRLKHEKNPTPPPLTLVIEIVHVPVTLHGPKW